MPTAYHVRVTKDYLVFSSAHFITFNRDVCERLHGHNYRVAVEVYGPLDENQYVVDFVALREIMKELIGELDHRMLLPTDHPQIKVQAEGREVTVTFRERRWIFPQDDCVLLPVANTTAELLAEYLGRRLLGQLEQHTGARPPVVRIEVDECEGQVGVCELVAE